MKRQNFINSGSNRLKVVICPNSNVSFLNIADTVTVLK